MSDIQSEKTVTLTELRRNLEAYLDQAQQGDITITRYGKPVGRLVGAGVGNVAAGEKSDEGLAASAA